VADDVQAVLSGEGATVVNLARVVAGAGGARWVALAGAIALVAIGLFFTVGQPFGTVNDVALLVMTLSLGPVMLAHYELGGVVPLWPARLSLAAATAAVAGWSIVQAAMILGLVAFDYDHAATGAFALNSVLQAIIGLWIGGASLLAGRWLPPVTRILGIVAGLGTVVMSAGLLLGGVNHTLTYIGGLGYQVALPIWAFVLSRVFSARAVATEGAMASSSAAGAASA
jgi:hypothetical protein